MAGVVQSGIESENELHYEKIIQLKKRKKASTQLMGVKALIENGNVLRLNRSITDNHINELLEANSYFKNEILVLSNLHLNFEAYSTLTNASIIELVKHSPHLKKINLKSCALIS